MAGAALGAYQNVKGYALTVVFDGWRLRLIDEVEEKRNGVTVVYSGRRGSGQRSCPAGTKPVAAGWS